MKKHYKCKKWISIFCICMLILSISGCNELENNKNSILQKTVVPYEKDDKNELLDKAIALAEIPNKEKEAYEAYQRVIEEENNPMAYVGIAYLYSKKKNFKKAIEYIELTKDNLSTEVAAEDLANIYYIMGVIYKDTSIYEYDKWDEAAIAAFNEAAQIPNLSEEATTYYTYQAYQNIANIAKDRQGKEWLESAIAGTKVLLEMNPENEENYIYTLADLYGEKGDFKKADEYIKMLKGEDEEGKIDMIFLYAKYYCYQGKYELAKQYMDQLNINNCSNQKEKYYMLKAFYAEKIGDKQDVKENIEALLDLDVTYLNTGIVRSIMEESNVAINSSYQECLENEKEESYKIVLGE